MSQWLFSRLPPGRDLWPLGLVVLAGGALRVFLSIVYVPAALNQYDAPSYVYQAEGGLFESYFQAPGYSFFLRVLHLASHEVAFTISVQHLLALATAVLAWHVVYRLTSSRWLSLVPAGFVLFEADTLLVEHALMSETLFVLLVVAVVWTALGAPDAGRPLAWLAAAGLLLGAAVWVRYAAIVLVPILIAWAIVVAWPDWRRGLARAALAAGPAAALIALLVVLQGAQNGHYGLGESGGWALYGRVAAFADCDEFEPPPGTERLCEETPPSERLHPDWYGYDRASPAIRLFPQGQPQGNAELGAWARRAILAQPLDYASAVADDLGLYFDEAGWTNRNESLIGPRGVSFRLRTPDEHCPDCAGPPLGIEQSSLVGWTDPHYGAYYDEFVPTAREGIEFFQGYQGAFRLHGLLFAALAVLAVLGLFVSRGAVGRAQWLVTPMAVAILVFPVATTTYNARYAIPAIALFAIAAALAARSLLGPSAKPLASPRGADERR